MKTFYFWVALFAAMSIRAEEIPGVPRDSNFGNTGGYNASRVEAHLQVQVDRNTEKILFIRDNNDPRVVTKCYLLKNVDPYQFRDYLRQMVQSKRVGNATLEQQYPAPAATAVPSGVSAPVVNGPAAQPGYNPPVQLGSNTAVECLKYVDGTGLLIVSAEEYRFKDHENGIGIDKLVATLDDPALGVLSYGSQMFIYMPKFVPASYLKPMIENVGMNINDVTELWQGGDIVATDPDLNWLIFDVSNYSCSNIAKLLAKYDVPLPQVRLHVTVYEIYRENDERMGIDFQNWKNNEGADLFSAGGRYRNNWAAIYDGSRQLLQAQGSERTSFYNFNPRWNTRYIDFLAATGKARVVHTGELCIRNSTSANLSRKTSIFYSDTCNAVPAAGTTPDTGVGPYELLSSVIQRVFRRGSDVPVGKGEAQVITPASLQFGFSMDVDNVAVGLDETHFNVKLTNTSLIGFTSKGLPRLSPQSEVVQTVSLPHGTDAFVIGGLQKHDVVKSRTGIPFLKDIPYLGYLFSTESSSVKHAELVVVARCQWDAPPDNPAAPASGRTHMKP
ncbi:MAG: hypothetical protein J6S73_09510 [Lentisphaeria bacterium]|nr:hypothetical protein [Lentisphaeria bacterium]